MLRFHHGMIWKCWGEWGDAGPAITPRTRLFSCHPNTPPGTALLPRGPSEPFARDSPGAHVILCLRLAYYAEYQSAPPISAPTIAAGRSLLLAPVPFSKIHGHAGFAYRLWLCSKSSPRLLNRRVNAAGQGQLQEGSRFPWNRSHSQARPNFILASFFRCCRCCLLAALQAHGVIVRPPWPIMVCQTTCAFPSVRKARNSPLPRCARFNSSFQETTRLNSGCDRLNTQSEPLLPPALLL